MGSVCVYPHRSHGDATNKVFRELRVMADLGYKTAIRLTDMTDTDEIDVTVKHSNVVISSVGSKKFYKDQAEFEEANIKVPMAIAKSVRANPHIKRFVYISAAGADPNSPSRFLRTKWIGEQEVKEIYPDVTILKPCTMFNTIDPALSFQNKWGYFLKLLNKTFPRVEGSNGLMQPVFNADVSLAVLNALKMDETIGQTYELGGPHVYTMDEIYELMYNAADVQPYTVPIPMETVMEWMHSHKVSSVYRVLGKYWMYPEFVIGESIDVTCSPGSKGFEDLYIKPVSFAQKVKSYVLEIANLEGTRAETDLHKAMH